MKHRTAIELSAFEPPPEASAGLTELCISICHCSVSLMTISFISPVTVVLQADRIGVAVSAEVVQGKALRHHQARERAQEVHHASPNADQYR